MELINKKCLVICHADFDGITSTINIFNIIENPEDNFQYYVVMYDNMDKILNKVKNEVFDILFILDLNLTKDNLNIISTYNYKKIIHIDHHNYEYNLNEYITEYNITNYTFIHDETISAALATNRFISRWHEAYNKCIKFSELAEVYDMWRKESPKWKEAYAINDLFWEYKYEKFFKKFKNGYKLDSEDKETILRINKERQEYIEDTFLNHFQFNEDYKIVYIFNPKCKYINHITTIFPASFYVILKSITEDTIAYSLRLYDDNFKLTISDLCSIIQRSIPIITYGGHKKIGSLTISKEYNVEFLETINNIFEVYNG